MESPPKPFVHLVLFLFLPFAVVVFHLCLSLLLFAVGEIMIAEKKTKSASGAGFSAAVRSIALFAVAIFVGGCLPSAEHANHTEEQEAPEAQRDLRLEEQLGVPRVAQRILGGAGTQRSPGAPPPS